MFTRKLVLLNAALLLFPALSMAQAERSRRQESTTTTTTQTTEEKHRQDLFEEIGWEVAEVDGGVRIERIVKNSPAAEAHLEEKDIITKIGGENVLSPERVSEVIASTTESGENKTEVVVLRDGEELSYLLTLDKTKRAGTTTSTTTRSSETDLVQMIQQLQLESQQQQALLQALLVEVQSLRQQLGVGPAPRVGVAPAAGGTTVTGDIVAPAGTLGIPSGTQTPANPRGPAPVRTPGAPQSPNQ